MDKHTLKNIRAAKIYGNSIPITKHLDVSEKDVQILYTKVIEDFPGIKPHVNESYKEENKNG